MRRLALASLLLSLLAAGCSEAATTVPCPGTPIATLAFTGTRTWSGCREGGPAAGVNAIYPDDQISFSGTLSATASGTGAALCLLRAGAEPLVGTLEADHVIVELKTSGALLGGCSASCAVTVLQQVSGTVLRAPGGAPTGFTGTLLDLETLDASVAGASCTPCTTPCQASYALSAVSR